MAAQPGPQSPHHPLSPPGTSNPLYAHCSQSTHPSRAGLTLCGLYLHPEAHPGGYHHLWLASFYGVPGVCSRLVVEASAVCLHVLECCWACVRCGAKVPRGMFSAFFAHLGCCRPAVLFPTCYVRSVGPVSVEILVIVRSFTSRTPKCHT